MMVKDRIEQFRGIKEPKSKGEDIDVLEQSNEEDPLKPNTNKSHTKKKPKKECFVLEEIFKNVDELISLIDKVQDKTFQLQKYHVILQHSTRLDPVIREKADDLNESILNEAHITKIKIQSIISEVVKTQKSLLNRRLRSVMESFEKALQAHQQICKTIIQKQLHIVDKEVTEDELLAIIDTQDSAVFVDDYVKETSEAMQSLQDAKDRHKEILAIERDITTIRNMFCDLALNVTQQGEMIDTIEYHVGNGIILAQKGHKRLTKAHRFMQKARKKKVLIILCLTSVIVILILGFICNLYL